MPRSAPSANAPGRSPMSGGHMNRHIHTLTPGREMAGNIWHAAYVRWYDNREAGNAKRAKVWGVIADGLCRLT